MRLLWAFLGLLMALPAYADISDSGSMTIGGQAIVSGSMTVTGAVGAASMTVTASGAGVYSITSSSGIHLIGGKLKLEPGTYLEWPDGKTSTTSSSGGGGNSVNPSLISSGVFSSVGALHISGLPQDRAIEIEIVGTQNTSNANHQIKVSSDSAANYDWTGGGWWDSSGSGSGGSYADSRGVTVPKVNRDSIVAARRFKTHLELTIPSTSSTTVEIMGTSAYKWSTAANTAEHTMFHISYSSAGYPISSINYLTTAGSISGIYWAWGVQ